MTSLEHCDTLSDNICIQFSESFAFSQKTFCTVTDADAYDFFYTGVLV